VRGRADIVISRHGGRGPVAERPGETRREQHRDPIGVGRRG
jgi:hypothetical protein